jgi:hypothetical protein
MRAVVSVFCCALAVGCGAGQEGADSDEPRSSARFAEVTNWVVEGELMPETVKGAYDWSIRHGWAEIEYVGAPAGTIRQLGDDCFGSEEGGRWSHWRPEGAFCEPDMFDDPARLFEQLRRDRSFERIGDGEIRGVRVTHYRAVPEEVAPGDVLEPIEVWVDEAGVALRVRYGGAEATPRTRDYFDFGVEVAVERPPDRLVVQEPPEVLTEREIACAGSYEKRKPEYCFTGTTR